jgi:hypothetical protein
VVRNINPLERFLPKDNMRQLLAAILDCQDKPIEELATRYQEECYKHCLYGGAVSSPQPVVVGRAVERDYFISYLYKNCTDLFSSTQLAEGFVNRLCDGGIPRSNEGAAMMSSFGAWVTWDENSPISDPFSFVERGTAEEIRACLGLDTVGRNRGIPMLLLVYRRGSQQLLRPTVADAGLFPLFEPPPVGMDGHGWTKTWSRGIASGKFSLRPRPEAVHSPLPFRNLMRPLRQVP